MSIGDFDGEGSGADNRSEKAGTKDWLLKLEDKHWMAGLAFSPNNKDREELFLRTGKNKKYSNDRLLYLP